MHPNLGASFNSYREESTMNPSTAQQPQSQSQSQQQQQGSRSAQRSVNMAEIALRGAKTLVDIELATMRNLVHMQARTAAIFGVPDCSELFNATDKLVKSQLSASTDQILDCTRQISQAVAETQGQFGRVLQQSTSQLAEEIRKGVEEVGQQTRQSMQELTEMAQRQAEQSQQDMEAMSNAGSDMSRSNGGQKEGDSDMQFKQPPTDEANRNKGAGAGSQQRKL
jgi:gas vesicle protein